MKFANRKRVFIYLPIVVALGFLGWKVFFGRSEPPQHLTTPVTKEDLKQEVLASGVLKAIKQVDVGAQVNGQLKKLYVEAGSTVKKGQLLAEIDPEHAQNGLKGTQANLDYQLAQRDVTRAGLQQAKQELTRQQAMMRDESTTQKSLEAALAEVKKQQATLLGLEAQIRRAQSERDKAKIDLGFTRILAPMDGEVLSIETQEGQTIIAAQQAPVILKLADLSTIRVRAQVSEADIIRVKPGMEAYFTLLGDTEKRIKGQVRSIEPKPEKINNAMFYNTLFDVPNLDQHLRVDMTAQVGILEREARQVLAIPLSVLGPVEKDGRYPVQVRKADGQLDTRQVRIGLKTATRAEVLEGLRLGEQVVTRVSHKPGEDGSGSVGF
ncbi:macrolide transporter subunit MacA [Chitinimonas sp. BJB300]|uniref:macrolide transporter subunit MacA n=1 Tax=Chitinimonas sp. BJB300 TaxID=1559339 RepID=UPI000C0EF84D|nr:macrolide transporter subunit MacA [Chitinimonas sp. BJB300]PHV12327.1 macrolide transporter subunit MacA [Chitinimonas sp. BJB300]TSJ90948.1 macrolide transporter subunit MacA [Chitinimonas sp. BJB300]